MTCFARQNDSRCSDKCSKVDGLVKSLFSTKDVKDVKGILFNISKLTLRALREILIFYECIKVGRLSINA